MQWRTFIESSRWVNTCCLHILKNGGLSFQLEIHPVGDEHSEQMMNQYWIGLFDYPHCFSFGCLVICLTLYVTLPPRWHRGGRKSLFSFGVTEISCILLVWNGGSIIGLSLKSCLCLSLLFVEERVLFKYPLCFHGGILYRVLLMHSSNTH